MRAVAQATADAKLLAELEQEETTGGKPAPVGEPAELKKYERDEIMRARTLLAGLGRSLADFRSQAYLTALLCGGRTVTKALWDKLLVVLQRHSENLRGWISMQKPLQQKAAQIQLQNRTALATGTGH